MINDMVFYVNNKSFISDRFETYGEVESLASAPKLCEPAYLSRCSRCRVSIKPTQSSLHWGILDFCGSLCYEVFMYETVFKCSTCGHVCKGSVGSNVHLINDQIFYFCNNQCETLFFASPTTNFCRLCRNVIDFTTHLKGFCQLECQQKFHQINGHDRRSIESQCYQCRLVKRLDIFLSADDGIFGFCSFACFFHMKISNAIFPGTHFQWM